MTNNEETPGETVRAVSRGPKNLLGGGSDHIVPQGTDEAHPAGLFPAESTPVYARPVLVATSGRIEYAARCPKCANWHRHVSLGEKSAPCGAVYLLESRRGRRAA